MSNRRIRKKRAKAQWERDKSRMIAAFLVWMEPDAEREEYLRMAAVMWQWDKETLFRRIDEMMCYRIDHTPLPFRVMKRPAIRLEAAEEGTDG